MTHEDSSRFLGINEHPYSHTMTSSFGCWQNDEMWKIDRFDDEGGPKKNGGKYFNHMWMAPRHTLIKINFSFDLELRND